MFIILFVGAPVPFSISIYTLYVYNMHITHDIDILFYDSTYLLNNYVLLGQRQYPYTFRINMGRRVSPKVMYSKNDRVNINKKHLFYFTGINLVSSYFLHSALCTNRFVWVSKYQHTYRFGRERM